MAATTEADSVSRLGRLTALGPRSLDDLPLLLPHQFEDCRADGTARFGLIEGPIRTRVDGRPRVMATWRDDNGTWPLLVFGRREQLSRFMGAPVVLRAREKTLGEREWLIADELVERRWLTRPRPVYPGCKRIGADAVRERMLALLPEAIPHCVEALSRRLASFGDIDAVLRDLGAPTTNLAQLLQRAHLPATIDEGIAAQAVLASLVALERLRPVLAPNPRPNHTPRVLLSLGRRAAALGFRLNRDQSAAISAIAAGIASPRAVRALLLGPTGSGKTATFGVIVAALADAGGRAMVMLPSTPLAEQVYAEFRRWWPDLSMALVTADSDASDDLREPSVLIGTTALLHRITGRLELTVCDEQQRYSVAQREWRVLPGAHLVEATATCLPRSLALARFGAVETFRLSAPVATRAVATRCWSGGERRQLFAAVRQTLAAGGQVLVVYPRRVGKRSVAESAIGWERAFPGLVRAITGKDKAQVKREAIAALRANTARILVSTTVVETGIDLPNLRRVVIVGPETLGLTQIHQLRGRVARTGGEGHCDLYSPEAPGEAAQARLERARADRRRFCDRRGGPQPARLRRHRRRCRGPIGLSRVGLVRPHHSPLRPRSGDARVRTRPPGHVLQLSADSTPVRDNGSTVLAPNSPSYSFLAVVIVRLA